MLVELDRVYNTRHILQIQNYRKPTIPLYNYQWLVLPCRFNRY